MAGAARLGRLFGHARAWPFWAGAAVILCIVAAVVVRNAALAGELMRTDPGRIAANPRLVRFAITRGRSVYRDHCAACHGAQGRGDSAQGAPNLTDADWLYGSGQVDEIERVVLYGIRAHDPRGWNLADMPGFARPVPYPREPTLQPLTPDDMDDVVDFLVDRGSAAASAARGAAIFAGKGECYDCHSADAKGDTAIGAPNLTDGIWLYGTGSRQDIRRSIAWGRQGVCPAHARTLTPVSIRTAAVYVYSLSHPNAEETRR